MVGSIKGLDTEYFVQIFWVPHGIRNILYKIFVSHTEHGILVQNILIFCISHGIRTVILYIIIIIIIIIYSSLGVMERKDLGM